MPNMVAHEQGLARMDASSSRSPVASQSGAPQSKKGVFKRTRPPCFRLLQRVEGRGGQDPGLLAPRPAYPDGLTVLLGAVVTPRKPEMHAMDGMVGDVHVTSGSKPENCCCLLDRSSESMLHHQVPGSGSQCPRPDPQPRDAREMRRSRDFVASTHTHRRAGDYP
jgi:hypothetical protein